MLEKLNEVPPDAILSIIGQYRADKRDQKIDLGLGVYKNDEGQTPVMQAVKLAERHLVDHQESKSYIGPAGNIEFVDQIRQLTFGAIARDENRLYGIQTPSGTAALRLASDLIKRAKPDASIWLGAPSWANHIPIIKAAGLNIETFDYYRPASQSIDFQYILETLSKARAGDLVLLQASCHNPTGYDFKLDEWKALSDVCNQVGLIPFIDNAYQGFGRSLDQDVEGLNLLLGRVPEAFVTITCSKNFGLYRERTGALFVLSSNHIQADIVKSNLFSISRANYSMPPDHGAAVVSTILKDPGLKKTWMSELNEMRGRMMQTRQDLVTALGGDNRFQYLLEQKGMFSMLPLSSEQISGLRDQHAIYMAGNGRINIAGFKSSDIQRFASILTSVL